MPCARATRRATALAVVGLVATGFVAGCASDREATGFCATITHGNAAFDSLDIDDAPKALAEFNRTAAAAPKPLQRDLRIVSAFYLRLYGNPSSLAGHPEILKRYAAAAGDVETYLHDTCGVEIPRRGNL